MYGPGGTMVTTQTLPNDIQSEYPFSSHFLKVRGDHNYHFVDEGQGEPILLLHGNPTWSFYYRNLIKKFSSDHRVIAPDHIGCGLSDKPQDFQYLLDNHIRNVEELVIKLDLKNITLILHDWGGAIGMGLATRHPERIKKIVLLNTAAFLSETIPFRINICRTPLVGEAFIRAFNGFALPATFMATTKGMKGAVKKGYLYPYNNYKNRIATAKFVLDIPMSKSHPSYDTLKVIEENLPKLKCPVLVIWGKQDFCFNDTFLERWKEIYPKAKFVELGEAGHYVLEDCPERCSSEIEGFLAQ